MSDSEFGPWIAHDGNGCPVIGQIVQADYYNGVSKVFVAKGGGSWTYKNVKDLDTWSWHSKEGGAKAIPIIRYRIKKPRGLTLLEEILKEVDDTHPLKVKRFKEESLP